ncbi:MAG: acyltransferase, partial [Candidatus Adiutrix sp.]|nr:acyltransferase [Candidatus Adiutrix sp.]
MAEDRSDIHSRYRPEIDGLRSVAVMSVLLYHAGFNFCSGGFVGVDVFFVISGFLITGILLDDLDAGIFSLKNFYERRLRRILPPLFAMSVVVAALAWLYLLPFDFKNYGRSLAAMAAFWANIFFWKQSGYFDAASFAKPLLHTWSLSVEEQFYILFPFFLRFFYRWVKARLPLFLLMSFFLSLMVSAVQVEYQPDMAFYWLHSRAWELLAGSLTAVWSRHPDHPALRLTGRFPSAFAFLGLAAMLGPICLYEETTSFPGLAALPPTLGTALIILAHHGGASSSPAGRILASAPFTGLGKISYSLYLWHWPLLAMPRYAADAPLSAGQAAAALAAAFIPAWLSWRFVENPVRRREVFRSRRAVFIAAGVGLVVLAAAGRIVRTADGFPGRLPPAARLYAAAAEDSYRSAPAAPYFKTSVDGVGYTVKAWPVGPRESPPFFLLWGDSHARMWRAAFDRLAEENQ